MGATTTPTRFRRTGAVLLALGLVVGVVAVFGAGTSGAASDREIDFVAAGPNTYRHQPVPLVEYVDPFGYQERTISRDTGVVESLEGGDYACFDRVPFFALLNPEDAATTVTARFEFDRYPTANQKPVKDPGVGYRSVDQVIVSPDEAVYPAGTTTTVQGFTTQTVNGDDQLQVDVEITGVPDAGFVLRLDLVIGCDVDADPKDNEGTIQARFVEWAVDGVTQSGGDQTITMKSASDILEEERAKLTIVKDAVGNAAQDFTFRLDKPDETTVTFTLDDDSDPTLANSASFAVVPGEYGITETAVPTGWTFTNVVCDDEARTSATVASVTITLVDGDDVTCTFTNTKDTIGTTTTTRPFIPDGTTTLPPTTTTTTLAPTTTAPEVAPVLIAPAPPTTVAVLGVQLARTGDPSWVLVALAGLLLSTGGALVLATGKR
jgi:hypothetical protein